MKCAYPVAIGNGLLVPCGRCYYCRMQKRSAWVFRMMQELKFNPNCVFVTFTYNEDNIQALRKRFDRYKFKKWYKILGADFESATLSKEDCTELIQACQYNIKQLCGKKALVRYYITAEYGDTTNRPHFHGVFWFPKKIDYEEFFHKVWIYGNIDLQEVTPANINYIAKHQMKDCKGNLYQQKFAPIFSRMTRYNGGLGKDFLENEVVKDYYKQNRFNSYVILNNYKIPLPSFYRKKLFDKMTYEDYETLLHNQDETIKAHGNFESYLRDLKIDNSEKWRRYYRLKKTRKYIKNLTKGI